MVGLLTSVRRLGRGIALNVIEPNHLAAVAELEYAWLSEGHARKGLGVQIPPAAPPLSQ